MKRHRPVEAVIAACTKAHVASCAVGGPAIAVGACGEPVKMARPERRANPVTSAVVRTTAPPRPLKLETALTEVIAAATKAVVAS